MRALRWDEKAAIECGFVNALSWDGGATLRSCGGNLKVDRLVTFGVIDMYVKASKSKLRRTLQLSAAKHAFQIGIATDGDYYPIISSVQRQGSSSSACVISLHAPSQPWTSSLDTVSWKKNYSFPSNYY